MGPIADYLKLTYWDLFQTYMGSRRQSVLNWSPWAYFEYIWAHGAGLLEMGSEVCVLSRIILAPLF